MPAPAPKKQTPDAFLQEAGWGRAQRGTVAADWSIKNFYHLRREDGAQAILMVWNDAQDPMDVFLKLSGALRNAGLSAPEIYAQDDENGYVLCEDFGYLSFGEALKNGEDIYQLYAFATDVLKHLFLSFEENELGLPDYFGGRIHRAKDFIVSHYWNGTSEQVASYNRLWNDFESKYPPCPKTLLHGDYHPLNLFWLPERNALQRVGLIDYANAMWGPVPYDLVNLLEDIRVDVPEDIKAQMRVRYCEEMNQDEKSLFNLWYDVLTFQFHSRIIGQIKKLDREDLRGFLPRMERRMKIHFEKEMFRDFEYWKNAQGFCL